jgi:hypothetical protein
MLSSVYQPLREVVRVSFDGASRTYVVRYGSYFERFDSLDAVRTYLRAEVAPNPDVVASKAVVNFLSEPVFEMSESVRRFVTSSAQRSPTPYRFPAPATLWP